MDGKQVWRLKSIVVTKPNRHSRDRETRVSAHGVWVSRSLKHGVGLIYDRLSPESPGAIFSSSYIKIRKLLAAETGRKSSSVIPRNEWPRGMAAQLPPSRRVATRAERTRRRIYIILSGQWTERCRRSLIPSPEYPCGSTYVFWEFRIKARDVFSQQREEKYENYVKPRGNGDWGTKIRRQKWKDLRSGWPI